VITAPADFTATVLARVRRERWRADQQVDWVFNIAVAAGIVLIALGAVAMFNSGSVTAGILSFGAAVAEAASQDATPQPKPALWSYVLACALMGTSLLVWRWAEKN
jgi:hypothetical protein